MTRLWQSYLDLFSTPRRIITFSIVGYLALLAVYWFRTDMSPGWFVAAAVFAAVCFAIGTVRSIRRLQEREDRTVAASR